MYHALPSSVFPFIRDNDDVVLLDTLKFDQDNYRSYLFCNPVETLNAASASDVSELLRSVERYLSKDHYACGFFTYECGLGFENIPLAAEPAEPLASIGIYRAPMIFNHLAGEWENDSGYVLTAEAATPLPGDHTLNDLHLEIGEREYCGKINRIREYIRNGDTYQINFTSKYRFELQGSPLDLYLELRRKQRAPYAAIMKNGNRSILSLSPELFYRTADNSIVAKPMKGTAKRGRTCEEDIRMRDWLANDPKNRSENVMIVDLLRNDIGRIAEPGSVMVRSLFDVEKYDTLFQMTSTVEGRLKNGVSASEIVKTMSPSGSVTGAPKIRSMQLINELEQAPRGVYTGAIGFLAPKNESVFNVAIRTITIDGNSGSMGVGSGIVYDSSPETEYAECKLKADFLTAPLPEFFLLESLLWQDGFPFLHEHMKRLTSSAEYFDFPCNVEFVKNSLLEARRQFASGVSCKVRMTLSVTGAIRIFSAVIQTRTADAQPKLIRISNRRINSDNRFLYHKTTNRDIYDGEYNVGTKEGLEDIIFLNEHDEITEGTRNNIFIRNEDGLVTPPVEGGLLNGIYRQHILATNPNAVIKPLKVSDLRSAEAIFLCNAVRGMREVKLA